MSTPHRPPAEPGAISVTRAVEELARGKLVAFPTETVYGLGADAANPQAVAKIFAANGRPANHPLIVHLSSEASLVQWAVDVPDAARLLVRAFWPGPLTLILAKAPRVPLAVTGGQETQLRDLPGLDDGPEYSPSGEHLWCNSVRTGLMQIWRMEADGSGLSRYTGNFGRVLRRKA